MCHLVGIVVQSYDGFPLLYARQYYHKSSVSHHQVQVVPGQVKVHRLAGDKKGKFLFLKIFTFAASLQQRGIKWLQKFNWHDAVVG